MYQLLFKIGFVEFGTKKLKIIKPNIISTQRKLNIP